MTIFSSKKTKIYSMFERSASKAGFQTCRWTKQTTHVLVWIPCSVQNFLLSLSAWITLWKPNRFVRVILNRSNTSSPDFFQYHEFASWCLNHHSYCASKQPSGYIFDPALKPKDVSLFFCNFEHQDEHFIKFETMESRAIIHSI